jgi:hypothetical protein
MRKILTAMLLLTSAASQGGTLGDKVVLDAVYTADFLRNQRGGLEQGSAYVDNLDLMLDVDASDSLGGRAFAYVLYNNGEPFSASRVGDAQVTTNIETVRAWRLVASV